MGKDTVADHMLTILKGWDRRSFGDELKSLVSRYFEISLQDIEEYKSKSDVHPKIQQTMRNVLQIVGETFRSICPDVWVKAAMRNVDTNVIFTDVRHDNEMLEIMKNNGYLILLGRTRYLNKDPHPSESGLRNAITWFLENTDSSYVCVKNISHISVPEEFQKFSYFVRNDSTLKELQSSISQIIHDLKLK
tara:strand:- start:114 stop:686 length:573 start_codon:yes stop_codon:yes gene_type:complete